MAGRSMAIGVRRNFHDRGFLSSKCRVSGEFDDNAILYGCRRADPPSAGNADRRKARSKNAPSGRSHAVFDLPSAKPFQTMFKKSVRATLGGSSINIDPSQPKRRDHPQEPSLGLKLKPTKNQSSEGQAAAETIIYKIHVAGAAFL
jgi:hypothetical protein